MTKERRKAVLERLAQLENANGRLTPEDVVKDAHSPDSPLHDEFLWDDTAAAHQYRLSQARHLITVRIQVVYDERVIAAPYYVRDPIAAGNEQGYVQIARLRSEADQAQSVMFDELARIEAAIKRAKAVAGVLGMADEMDLMINQVTRIKSAIAEATAMQAEPESAGAGVQA